MNVTASSKFCFAFHFNIVVIIILSDENIVFSADDLTTHPSGEEVTVAGLHSILPKEHGNKFYELQILQHHDKDVSAVASWDSSIHDSQYLNRITEGNIDQNLF